MADYESNGVGYNFTPERLEQTRNIVVKSLAFEGPKSGPDRGFSIKAQYLSEPSGDALIEITRDGEPYRRFLYPAYKIWNLAAHFADIVESEIAGNFNGYDLAGWTGFSVILPEPIQEDTCTSKTK